MPCRSCRLSGMMRRIVRDLSGAAVSDGGTAARLSISYFFFLRFLLCFAFLSDENMLVQLDLRCCVSTANHITKSMVMRACAHFHFSHTHTRQPLLLRESIFAKCSGFRQDPFRLVLKGCFRRPEAILLTELHPRFFFIFVFIFPKLKLALSSILAFLWTAATAADDDHHECRSGRSDLMLGICAPITAVRQPLFEAERLCKAVIVTPSAFESSWARSDPDPSGVPHSSAQRHVNALSHESPLFLL